MEKKCERLLKKAVSSSLRNDDKRAAKYFEKALATANENDAAQVNYQAGAFELKRANNETAEKYLRSAADAMPDNKDKAGIMLNLGKCLFAQKKIDEAIKVLDDADKIAFNCPLQFEIKTLLSEARMLSDDVYETSLFIEAADYLISNNCETKSLLFRACSMAAVACSCMRYNISAGSYGLIALKNAESTNSTDLALKCASFACRDAIERSSPDGLVKVTETALDYIFDNGLESREDAQIICLQCAAGRIRSGRLDTSEYTGRSVSNILDAVGKAYTGAFTMYIGKFYSLLVKTGKAGLEKTLEAAADEPTYDQLLKDIETSETAQKAFSLAFYEACCPLFSHLLSKTDDKAERIKLLTEYSKACFILGDNDRCIVLCRELVSLCDETEADNDTTSKTYLRLALAQAKTGDNVGAAASYDIHRKYACTDFESSYFDAKYAFDEGLPSDYCAKLFRSLSEECEEKGITGESAVDINNRLGIALYRSDAPLEEETKAFERADVSAENDSELKCSNFHAVILSNLAECYSRADDNDKAFETYTRADGIFETCKGADIIQHTTCLKQMATILVGKGEYEEALKYLDRAVSALENYNVKYGTPQTVFQLSLCLNARGTVYYRMDKPEKEVIDLTKALHVIENNNATPEDKALIYTNRGEAYEKLNDSESMKNDFMKAIELLESCSDKDTNTENMMSRASKWLTIGHYREDRNELAESAQSYKNACSLLDDCEKQLGEDAEFQQMHAYSHFQYANACCHPANKNYNESLSAYCRSIDILEKLPDSESRSAHLCTVYEARSAFYEVFGEHSLAVADLEKAGKYRKEDTEDTIE